MSFAKNVLSGAGSVIVADMLGMRLPDQLDVGNLPVRQYGTAVAAVWGVHKVLGEPVGLKKALILGLASMAAADLETSMLKLNFAMAGLDVARYAAAGLGHYAAGRLGIG